jgi:hypothetical protein
MSKNYSSCPPWLQHGVEGQLFTFHIWCPLPQPRAEDVPCHDGSSPSGLGPTYLCCRASSGWQTRVWLSEDSNVSLVITQRWSVVYVTHILCHMYLLVSHHLPTCVIENRFRFCAEDERKSTLSAYSSEHVLCHSLASAMHFLQATGASVLVCYTVSLTGHSCRPGVDTSLKWSLSPSFKHIF